MIQLGVEVRQRLRKSSQTKNERFEEDGNRVLLLQAIYLSALAYSERGACDMS